MIFLLTNREYSSINLSAFPSRKPSSSSYLIVTTPKSNSILLILKPSSVSSKINIISLKCQKLGLCIPTEITPSEAKKF